MTIAHWFRASGAEQILPPLAPNAAPVPGAGVWGAWIQVVAACPNDYVMCGALVYYVLSGGTAIGQPGARGQIQIGIGALGLEVPIGQGAFAEQPIQVAVGGADTLFLCQSVFIPFKPVLIPAGTRIVARVVNINLIWRTGVYLTGYDSTTWDAFTPYYEGLPELYAKGLIGTRSRVYPDAAANIVALLGGWVMGNYTQFIAATPAPTLIRAVTMTPDTLTVGGFQTQMEIGVGPALGETVVGRVGFGNSLGGPGGTCELPRPYLVKTGERVAIRGAIGAGGINVHTMLQVEEML